MQPRTHSLWLLMLGCFCCSYWVSSAQQQGNILTGIIRPDDWGYFSIDPTTDFASFESIVSLFPSTTWPPARRLVAYGRYGSSKAVFVGGGISLDPSQASLTTLLLGDKGQLERIEVNVSLPKDNCGIWQLTTNPLNSKVYAFTQVRNASEFRLYEVHAETGATTLLGSYKHYLNPECWSLNGGVSFDPFREEVLLYASPGVSPWETWRISVHSGGKLVDHRIITQHMEAPVLSSDLKTFYSYGLLDNGKRGLKVVDAMTGQVMRSKNSTIQWTVQRNVAALDSEKGFYFAVGHLFGLRPHLFVFDINSLELLCSPYTITWDVRNLLFIPETF